MLRTRKTVDFGDCVIFIYTDKDVICMFNFRSRLRQKQRGDCGRQTVTLAAQYTDDG